MSESLIRIFDPGDEHAAAEIEHLRAGKAAVVDTYAEQQTEYAQCTGIETAEERWVYYPWRHTLVHTLGPTAFQTLRTDRNRNIITKEEQSLFASRRIAFAGLNVGNPGAVCIALEGGGRSMSLADPDTLSLTNLNRFRAGLPDLSVNKAELTARQILEIDPYYDLTILSEGIHPDSLESFIATPKADLLVEEMDQLVLKLAIRDVAKRHQVPVIMVTGSGPDVILDVERYDTEPGTALLNGHIPDAVVEKIRSPDFPTLAPDQRIALARDFMGSDVLHPRLVASFDQVGKTLVGIPQVAESSFLRGAALCFAARQILTGKVLRSGRYAFSFSETPTL